MTKRFLLNHRYLIIFIFVALVHVSVLALVRFTAPEKSGGDDSEYEVFKLVDVEEYVPPPPAPDTTVVYNQPTAAERVITTENEIIEIETREPVINYVPQHKISVIPDIPTREVLNRIVYPPMALRQEIEGVVYLELFIDQSGVVRKILVLKDPGYGFADAAVAALTGLRCKPAYANGEPVAVRFRYPVRFTVQR
ncbi:MAG TPA: energy transducer TonB [Treponemataceae bacterium]|jgi:protein TonB|nr:MAG: Gram-negative bacterial tonB protein [Spirochaetes bacterium ADurb.Bin215]HOF84621.1 energy transducer TonB [Treponemataceae bacterium]HOS35168.1 energy transducer TonB [Treponemataceae bacterium]HOU38074.1 energy transducer TonB [Treponemataceae bacterium]HPL91357.1 energy transducer TonB [Treponemataceae bacterium]